MSDENVVDFVPPEASNGPIDQPTEQERKQTRGERLVGLSFNPSGDQGVSITKVRAAKTIDMLLDTPIGAFAVMAPNGQIVNIPDPDHRLIIEEAVRRNIDAQMWAVKALTWGK